VFQIVNRLGEPLRDGCFAVGACYADDFQAARKVVIRLRCQYARALFQIADGLVRHFPFRLPFKRAIVVPIHKTCAVGNGGGNIISAVCILTLAGDEYIVWLDFAAIGVQPLAA
jgi:hypothetical protein